MWWWVFGNRAYLLRLMAINVHLSLLLLQCNLITADLHVTCA